MREYVCPFCHCKKVEIRTGDSVCWPCGIMWYEDSVAGVDRVETMCGERQLGWRRNPPGAMLVMDKWSWVDEA